MVFQFDSVFSVWFFINFGSVFRFQAYEIETELNQSKIHWRSSFSSSYFALSFSIIPIFLKILILIWNFIFKYFNFLIRERKKRKSLENNKKKLSIWSLLRNKTRHSRYQLILFNEMSLMMKSFFISEKKIRFFLK